MDFFEHQDRARRKTGHLVVYFVVAVLLIIVAVYLAVAGVLFYGHSRLHGEDFVRTLWFPDVFLAVSLATLAIVTGGSLYKIAELSGGGERVALALGGRPVLPSTLQLDERILLNVVEEMAIASGTPVPPVYLLEKESGINAFAAGTTPQNAVIGITRGALDTLKRDELQGVIAHEFSHILNGDMRLNLRLMGVLHGILLISLIGYVLMRTGGSSRSYSSSKSSREGGNPLPLLGLLLYVIGYIGVFFGHLIKSAVSRQREFLADASAVQFTRYPSGIAGALKKIGGLLTGSRIQSAHAEEASHMFFGNGLANSLLQALATHPPLIERIRRIEPGFQGAYHPTEPVHHSMAELIDPHTLAQRLHGAPAVHAAAEAGARAFQPQAAVAQIGEPRTRHMTYAADLIASLPETLRVDIRDPLGAVATVYALLLDADQPDVCQAQLDYLAREANPRAYQETLRVMPSVKKLGAETRLPLVSLVLPALHDLSEAQLRAFQRDVIWLIRADHKVGLFEYAVDRLVLKRLLGRLQNKPEKPVKYTSIAPLEKACRQLLSALAHFGGNPAAAATAFRKGAVRLWGERDCPELLPSSECTLRSIDEALDQMAGALPQLKKRILEGCATCIGADRRVTVEEGELLRLIADALDCPMPPLLADDEAPAA